MTAKFFLKRHGLFFAIMLAAMSAGLAGSSAQQIENGQFQEEKQPRIQDMNDLMIYAVLLESAQKCAAQDLSFDVQVARRIEDLVRTKAASLPPRVGDEICWKVHAFLAGRDVSPNSCAADLEQARVALPEGVVGPKMGSALK